MFGVGVLWQRYAVLGVFIFGLSFSNVAWSATKTWQGGDGVWNDAAHWEPAGVPESGDDILIDEPVVVTIDRNSVLADVSLTIGAEATLRTVETSTVIFAGTLINFGTLDTQGSFNPQGAVHNQSSGVVIANGTVDLGAVLENAGVFSSMAKLTLSSGAVLRNLSDAVVRIYASAPGRGIANYGLVENAGILHIADGATLGNHNGAQVQNLDTGILNIEGSLRNGVPNAEGGTYVLTNEGTINNNSELDNFEHARFINRGVINNVAPGRLSSYGRFVNWNTISGSGRILNNVDTFSNEVGATVDCGGLFSNVGPSGIVWNEGDMVLRGGLMNTGSFVSKGTLSFAGPDHFEVGSGATVSLGGTTVVEADVTLFNRGSVTVTASFENLGVIINEGSFSYTATGVIINEGSIDSTAGTFSGSGTFEGNEVLLPPITWDGGGDGVRWSDPLNWSRDELPDDDATIGGNAAVQITQDLILPFGVVVESGSSVTVSPGVALVVSAQGSVDSAGLLVINGQLQIHGSVVTRHRLSTAGNATVALHIDGTINNTGTVDISSSGAAGAVGFDHSGVVSSVGAWNITHLGSMVLREGAVFDNNGGIRNAGLIRNEGGAVDNVGGRFSNSSNGVAGTLDLRAGTFTFDRNGEVNNAYGTMHVNQVWDLGGANFQNGYGTLWIESGAEVSTRGAFANSNGTVVVRGADVGGAPAAVFINGATINNKSRGMFDIRGLFINQATGLLNSTDATIVLGAPDGGGEAVLENNGRFVNADTEEGVVNYGRFDNNPGSALENTGLIQNYGELNVYCDVVYEAETGVITPNPANLLCACPNDPDDDADGDEVCGDVDNCPSVANPDQADRDGDGVGDACDACANDAANDADGDGVCGDVDNCPEIPNDSQGDRDWDGVGDACDACANDAANDADGDGICGNVDNCATVANADQRDTDGDGVGDACDVCALDPVNDADGDGVCANADNCAGLHNPQQEDADGDGVGDACDSCPYDAADDVDADGLCADVDNCPADFNPFQEDLDMDGAGDVCDEDDDGDGVSDSLDNCPMVPNGDQADSDLDGVGDACDDSRPDNDAIVAAIERIADDCVALIQTLDFLNSNSMIRQLVGNGGITAHVAAAVKGYESGELSREEYIARLEASINRAAALERRIRVKSPRQKSGLTQEEAAELRKFTAALRVQIEALIDNA